MKFESKYNYVHLKKNETEDVQVQDCGFSSAIDLVLCLYATKKQQV